MSNEHQILNQVQSAKNNDVLADQLIRDYMPFINAEVSRFLNRFVSQQDDEHSIGLMAFHEAIQGYSSSRGSFLKYASMIIKSRLIDFKRAESRHWGIVSLDESIGDEEDTTLLDTLPSKNTDALDEVRLEATQQEILELTQVLDEFGVKLSDVADNSPKQERTLSTCKLAIQYAKNNPEILEELLQTKKLPLSKLIKGSGADRKTIERHRKYVLTMLVILTNGYDIIRGHLVNVLSEKGGHYS